ncbi:signal peptidase I [Altererythrobacter sp. Root672]|uniref:signal peptidase I n=1 Tax=Altererythrobacter sp. Root672 TaxID=1736584 RepID=UPI0006F63074|nr:signal peptidase I [Altererythrobacter sp. Root672]KRA83570.1 S26 family signal peptidase [Altererythrobacter sp. Root672]
MSENAPTVTSEPVETPPAPAAKAKKKEDSFLVFLIKLVVVVLIFRTFLFTSFSIPSESMMPRLLVGDYLFAAKWPYGYSGASLPIDWKTGKRIFGSQPERGDVVIFKHPIDRTDYVKRVIGLPGDQVQMVAGVVHINGVPVKKQKIADFVVPVRPNGGCAEVRFTEREADGTFACRYPQYRETLPNGVSYNVLDFGLKPQDTTPPVVVPEDRLFLMGDNRDNSLDSRFPAVAQRGIDLVPQENLVGRASFMFFSTDGTAEWLKPWTWFTAARWDRMGRAI